MTHIPKFVGIHTLNGGHYYIYPPDKRDRIQLNCGSPTGAPVRVEAALYLSRDEALQLSEALGAAASRERPA